MNIESKTELIKKFGLSENEIYLFGTDFLLHYLKFHQKNKGVNIRIIFIGFNEDEFKELEIISRQNKIEIVTKLTLTFDIICINDDFDYESINNDIIDSSIIINKIEFLEIFKFGDYRVNDNINIYPQLVYEEYRITRPLSNFNYFKQVQSYSGNADEFYDINLYNGTCTCKDYVLNKRNIYQNGDLRRYCKHLKMEYKYKFSPKNIEGIKKYFFENTFYIKKYLKKITLPKVDKPVYLCYNLDDGECVIYFPSIDDSIEVYHYDYEVDYFSYNDKPYGHVKDLRIELNKIFKPNKVNYERKVSIKASKKADEELEKKIADRIIVVFFILVFIIFWILS